MFTHHRSTTRRHFRVPTEEQGGVAVEFALLTPILIMLLIGTVTTGISYSHALGVTNAVREGARFGAIADSSSASWANDVVARVRATQFDDLAATKDTAVCVQFIKGGSATKTYCDDPAGGVSMPTPPALTDYPVPPSVPATVCVVRVVAARNFTISAPPLMPPMTRTLTRGSVARYERRSC